MQERTWGLPSDTSCGGWRLDSEDTPRQRIKACEAEMVGGLFCLLLRELTRILGSRRPNGS